MGSNWVAVYNSILLLILIVYGVECRRRRFRECPEERLKVREGQADVILTGTVTRLHTVHGDGLYSGEVLVKRVLKGGHIKAGESLVVEGFGNTEICESKGKVKDSKIFLLNQLQTGRFRLNSSMIQINAPNLDKITAISKGVPYRRRPAIIDEPCEKKFCKTNGDCYMENRRTSCRCPTNCKAHFSPVCGSNGLTYNSECQLRVESCRQKQDIYVRNEGICLKTD